MIGIPKGSIENDLETLELNAKCKVDYAMCLIIQPYHKTEIYNIAKKEGLVDEEFEGFDNLKNPYGYHPPLKKSNRERLEVENLQKLFAFLAGVQFRFHPILVKTLIRLPLGKLYLLIYKFWFNFSRFTMYQPNKLHRIPMFLRT